MAYITFVEYDSIIFFNGIHSLESNIPCRLIFTHMHMSLYTGMSKEPNTGPLRLYTCRLQVLLITNSYIEVANTRDICIGHVSILPVDRHGSGSTLSCRLGRRLSGLISATIHHIIHY